MSLTDAAGRVPPHFGSPGTSRVVGLPGEESSSGADTEIPTDPVGEPARKFPSRFLLLAIGGPLLAGAIGGGAVYYQHHRAPIVQADDISAPAPVHLGNDTDDRNLAPAASREIAAFKSEPAPPPALEIPTEAAPPKDPPTGPSETPSTEMPSDQAKPVVPPPDTGSTTHIEHGPAAALPATPAPLAFSTDVPSVQTPTAANDPVAAASQSAPMESPNQPDVLAQVAQIGIVVRDLRTENAQIRAALDQLTTTVDTRTTEFDQRLALAEAKGAVAVAMGAGKPEIPMSGYSKPTTPVSAKRSTATSAGATGKPLDSGETSRRYRIQAASPGLAVLTALDAGPNETHVVQVAIGDPLPGFGKITGIFQRGTSWVVKAERGSIQ
jgi:hypothetical protein